MYAIGLYCCLVVAALCCFALAAWLGSPFGWAFGVAGAGLLGFTAIEARAEWKYQHVRR